MGSEIEEASPGRSGNWLTNTHEKGEPSHSNCISDEDEDLLDRSLARILVRPSKIRNFTLTHELRIFAGTWNVAGRSPVCSSSGDLEKWLNLKSAADIYVLGFQEIVPLNTRTLIGVLEDQSEATKWNLLIGKTLNKKEGSVWLTPTSNTPIAECYQYVEPSNSSSILDWSTTSSRTSTRERSKVHHGESNEDNTYMLIASKKMVGLFITIWMRKEMLRKYSVSNVKVCSVACGIMGRLGNKGAVSVSMSIEGTSFCFIAAHLASGEKEGNESRRNQQVAEIFKRTTFSRIPQENAFPLPLNIQEHDRIIWLGDLNYRLNLEDSIARVLIRRRNFKELQKFDQLKKELEDGGAFQGWREGRIEFAPTYKYYLSSTNQYSGNLPTRSVDKHRTPAWCDRIIWHGRGIEQLSYICGDSEFSDHRPVSALFTTEIHMLKSNPRAVALSKFLASMNLSRNNVRILVRWYRLHFSNGQKKVAEVPRSSVRALIRFFSNAI